MESCPSCGSQVAFQSRYCPSCGTPLGAATPPEAQTAPPVSSDADAVTFDATPEPAGIASRGFTASPRPSVGAIRTTPGILRSPRGRHDDALAPGDLLGDRYRIVALLGRGGMGEVYRADDLKLGQAVALKFLPRALERDPLRLDRFLNEIRTARDVSHPNVCRVYDVGEIDGRHFLSMEYVDGEDLASLLRRIGRLPADKAVDIARQLCAGLAAAHDKGVLHRDLKPANVMLDGRGKVRLTDFGLAEVAGAGAGDFAGTPAYMAPEQFTRQPASVQSDIYALGLVLYEVFTGKRVFTADTIAELQRLHEESRPPSLVSAVHDIDPAVERVILRCLEKDPHNRPATAIAVSAALPGGDPLAAALAAGETPSPDMVAAAGEQGGMRPAVALAWLGAIAIGLLATVLLSAHLSVLASLPLENSPDVLASKARGLLKDLGVTTVAADTAQGLESEPQYLRYVEARDHSKTRWKDLASGHTMLSFWYRTSPDALIPQAPGGNISSKISLTDPPMTTPGMTGIALDLQGRLLRFEFVPAQVEKPQAAGAQPVTFDWSRVLADTGVDVATATPAAPEWLPPVWADTRLGWKAHYPDMPGVDVRIEAAAYRGRPVYVQVVRPWTTPDRVEAAPRTARDKASDVVSVVILVSMFGASIAIARRNMLLGRGDRRGALRVAAGMGCVLLAATVLEAHHVASFKEVQLIGIYIGIALFVAAWMWLLYLAVEPFVRRRWPQAMITWNRVLIGRLRDPRLGRDVLIGSAMGIALALLEFAQPLIETLSGGAPAPQVPRLSPLMGARFVVNSLLASTGGAAFSVLVSFFLFFLLRLVTRRDWLMVVAFIAVGTLGATLRGASGPNIALNAAISLVMVTLLLRLGFVAFVVALIFNTLLTVYPLTTDLGSWYGTPTLFALAVLAAIVFYAFRTALGGKSLLGVGLQD